MLFTVYGQTSIFTKVHIDSNKFRPFTIDSVQVFMKTANNNDWSLLLQNESNLKFSQGMHKLRLIEYINEKKDSVDIELNISSNDYLIGLEILINISISSSMTRVDTKMLRFTDTTYHTSISVSHYELMPKKLKITPLKGSYSKFSIKNKTSKCIYGIGDSTIFYGILLQKGYDSWSFEKLNVNLLKKSYCIKPGSNHIAGVNEMLKNPNFVPSSGNYIYILNLSVIPIDYSFKKIVKKDDKNESQLASFFGSKSTTRIENENIVNFDWRIRTLKYFRYTYKFKKSTANNVYE